jgi:hypothetical protein
MDVYAADFTGLVQSFKLRRINPNVVLPLPDWEDKWHMSLNAKKCQFIRITPKNRPPLPTTFKLHGHTLDTVDASNYLGVTISNNLTWDRHIDNTIGKGNKTLGFIRRNLKDCTKPVKSAALHPW